MILHGFAQRSSKNMFFCPLGNQKIKSNIKKHITNLENKRKQMPFLGRQFMVVKLFRRFFCFKLLPLWAHFGPDPYEPIWAQVSLD